MADEDPRDRGLHPRNVEFFVEATERKPTVNTIERIGDRVFQIQRDRDILTVYVANIYILGVADVESILADHPEIDAIVNVNSYNTHTQEAKSVAMDRGVALFKISEFMGALYQYGQQFMEYTPPERDRDRNERGKARGTPPL